MTLLNHVVRVLFACSFAIHASSMNEEGNGATQEPPRLIVLKLPDGTLVSLDPLEWGGHFLVKVANDEANKETHFTDDTK